MPSVHFDPGFVEYTTQPTRSFHCLLEMKHPMGSQEDPGDFKQIIAKQYRGGKKHVAFAGENLADEALQTATTLHNELIGACLALTKKRTSKADSAVSLVEM